MRFLFKNSPGYLFLFILLTSCVTPGIKKDLASEYHNLGNAYYEMQKYDEAVRFFSRAIKLNPELLKAHYNLSLALIDQGKGNEAEKILKQLLEKDPENVAILQVLACTFYKEVKNEEALNMFNRILELAPENLNALYNKGIILWEMDRMDKAEACFKDVLLYSNTAEKGLFTDTLFNLGKLMLEKEEWEESVFFLDRFLELETSDEQVFYILANAYKGLERYNKALEAYESIISLNKNHASAWMGQAEILLTAVEDSINGLNALERALVLGFKDSDRIRDLLNNESLIDKESVEAILKKKSVMPLEIPSSDDAQAQE